MFKSGLLGFSKPSIEGDKQKQKKRLSFKDPEVEKSKDIATSAIARQQYESESGRIPSLENLTLEDEAFRIARHVGCAFVKPPTTTSVESVRTIDKTKVHTEGCQREILEKEVQPQGLSSKETLERKGYLDELSPPKPDSSNMRCPIVQFSPPESSSRNVELITEHQQERLPTIAHHQIQLLHYQLEQQRQQTQTALYQTQLLKDQLEAESNARYKAQVHNHQLMVQNKDLLDHIQKLFQQIQELEKKIDIYESNKETLKAQTNEAEQGIKPTIAVPNPAGYRRNSANIQSLWSSSSPAASGGQTKGTQLFQEPGSCDSMSMRRLSIKDDSSTKLSPYDIDWRYRRRGSNTFTPIALDQSKSRSSELNVSAEVHKTNTEPTLNHGLSTSIPELKVTSIEGIKRDEGGVRRKDTRLTIGDTSPEWTNGQTDTLVRDYKPSQSESSSVFSKTQTNLDKGLQRKFTKSLDALKLFN